MAVWKQIILSLLLIGIVGIAWYVFYPGAQTLVGKYVPVLSMAASQPVGAGAGAGNSAGPAAGGGGRGGFGGGGGRGGFGGNRATLVVVQQADTQITNDKASALGSGIALHAVVVTAGASGTLTGILAKSGEKVTAGQVIATLDSSAEQIAYDKAKIALEDAQMTLARYESLAKSNSYTQAQLQAVQLAENTAQLSFDNAALTLKNRSISSPIEGTLGILQVDIGSAVTTSTVIVTITDNSAILVSFWLPERLSGAVKLGAAVTATPVARPQDEVQGKVVAVDNKIDAASGTFQVQAEVPNTNSNLRAGMSFTVSMSFPGDSFVAVNPLAIQWGSDGSYVWQVVDAKAERVPVTIVQRNSESVLVSGPLKAGAEVVTEGLDGLRPGAAVQIDGQPVTPQNQSPTTAGKAPGSKTPASSDQGAKGTGQSGNGQQPGDKRQQQSTAAQRRNAGQAPAQNQVSAPANN